MPDFFHTSEKLWPAGASVIHLWTVRPGIPVQGRVAHDLAPAGKILPQAQRPHRRAQLIEIFTSALLDRNNRCVWYSAYQKSVDLQAMVVPESRSLIFYRE